MLKKIRKSSSRVTLVLIGLAGLAGCGDDPRDVYASREDCLADWGNKPEDCTPATDPGHASRGYFYGPAVVHRSWGSRSSSPSRSWSSSSSSSRPSSSGSSRSSTSWGSSGSSSRGGFGSSGRSSSS
ncbi:MAG TPA: hypothetical protein VFX72_05875 [Usitatibacteraceae bacterium]|nr:hypothetical protein [Usitatibacteraceae bacterium]